MACDCTVKTWKWARMYEEQKEGNVPLVNAKISWGQMEQLVAIMAICHKKGCPLLFWLCWWHIGCGNKWKRKSREVERWRPRVVPDPKSKYTEFSNSILPKFHLFFWTTCPYKERFRHRLVTERKRQWEVCEALKAINHRTPRGNIKIWTKADTGRERQLC